MRDAANDEEHNTPRIGKLSLQKTSSQERKNWREISKFQGFFITLLIVSFYAYGHWKIIKSGYFWNIELTIAFAIGMAFGFLENIKPGTNDTLVFFHKKLDTVWENGLCFVPSIFPFMHRVNIRPLWSLMHTHLENIDQGNQRHIDHELRIDSRNFQQVNATTSFGILKLTTMLEKIFIWFFSINKNPIFILQDFGLKIIFVVLFFDCASLSTTYAINLFGKAEQVINAKANKWSNQETDKTSSQTEKANEEKVYKMPDGSFVIRNGKESLTIPPNFTSFTNNRNQQECPNINLDWQADLVDINYLDFSNRGGCINIYPPSGKEIGLLFDRRPLEINGDFTISTNYENENKTCRLSTNDNCFNFIEMHLNEILVFSGSHIYVQTGK